MASKKAPTSEQSAKFIAAARELGCDEDEAKFNAALGKVARHKPIEAVRGTAKAKKTKR